MKQLKIFLFLILNIYHSIAEESTHESHTKDMGSCTCDLRNICDYRCCCDPNCDENLINDWKNRDMCIDIHKNIADDFKCGKTKSEDFNYNKEKATMTIKDHIYNIMCVQWDNSGEMEEYYTDYSEDINTQKEDWTNSFFKVFEKNSVNQPYKYGQRIDLVDYNQNILNTECIDGKYVYYLKPFESSCPKGTNFDSKIGDSKYSKADSNINREITYILKYNSNNHITGVEYNFLDSNHIIDLINFKVKWQKDNENDNQRSLPYGYQQGKPIKIAFKRNDTYNFYQNGYFLGISDQQGNCVDNINKAFNINPITFKNNIIYSCITENASNTYIYDLICGPQNTELKIGKAQNSSLSNDNDWFPLGKSQCDSFTDDKDIYINLKIFTSKGGKENNPYEYINNIAFSIENDTPRITGNKYIISFSIKYIDVSYSSTINSKTNVNNR